MNAAAGVRIQTAESVDITSSSPIIYHLDGEPIAGTLKLSALVRPAALRVRY